MALQSKFIVWAAFLILCCYLKNIFLNEPLLNYIFSSLFKFQSYDFGLMSDNFFSSFHYAAVFLFLCVRPVFFKATPLVHHGFFLVLSTEKFTTKYGLKFISQLSQRSRHVPRHVKIDLEVTTFQESEF